MIKGSLHNNLQNLDIFVRKMKEKLFLRKDKHPKDNISTTADIKEHLISEILELFLIENVEDMKIVSNILSNSEIDISEAKDVAIMCWALEFSTINDEEQELIAQSHD